MKFGRYKFLDRQTIKGENNDVYMVRYRLLRLPFLGIYLHHILRSDHDRHLHDHPWSFWSFILWGGYTEITPNGQQKFRAGRLIRHQAEDLHRLVLDKPAWTLVFVGPRRRGWGFMTDKGLIPAEEYENSYEYEKKS